MSTSGFLACIARIKWMFKIVLSFCLQFYERSNKVLYRLVLFPPKITEAAQTFQIGKKILLKMYLKIQLDPARKANFHQQHQSSQTLSTSEEKNKCKTSLHKSIQRLYPAQTKKKNTNGNLYCDKCL